MKRIFFISTVVGLNALMQLKYEVQVHSQANSSSTKGIIGAEQNSYFLVSVEVPAEQQENFVPFIEDLKNVMSSAIKGNANEHFRFK